jgi:hypothetical protein
LPFAFDHAIGFYEYNFNILCFISYLISIKLVFLNVFKAKIYGLPAMIPRLRKSHDSWVGCLFIIIKIFENISIIFYYF